MRMCVGVNSECVLNIIIHTPSECVCVRGLWTGRVHLIMVFI